MSKEEHRYIQKKRKQQKIIIVEEKDKFNRPFHSKKNKKLTCQRRKEHELLIPFKNGAVLFSDMTLRQEASIKN